MSVCNKRQEANLCNNIDISLELQQELDHIDLSKVAGHMKRRVARLGLRVHTRPGLDQHDSTVDLVLLGTQVQRGQTILGGRARLGLVVQQQRCHVNVTLLV